ncbi:MAG: discoidin domain-containing protein [Candidatus Eiseniibacteriota bacterium]
MRRRAAFAMLGVGALLSMAAIARADDAIAPAAGAPNARLWIDDFEETNAWSAHPADGVELKLASDDGLHGRSLRADFHFVHGGGYAVLRRSVALDLPDDYEFRLHLRGRALPNNLEFKLIDSTGDNVWWLNQRDVHFNTAWDSTRIRKRQIQFAWGPAGGGEIRHVAAIEIAITAGQGGEGSVWFDDLELVRREVRGPEIPLVVRASTARPGADASFAADSLPGTSWRSAPGDSLPWIAVDFGGTREYGGLSLEWEAGARMRDLVLERSDDGDHWTRLREVRGARRARDDVALPESESRWLRVRAVSSAGDSGCVIRTLRVQPLEFSATPAAFWRAIADASPRGRFPRSIIGEPSWWTVVGVEGADGAALINTDGAIEPERGGFSIEPFLRVDGRLIGWSDVQSGCSLEAGELPIPSVAWRQSGARLTVTACATGSARSPVLMARYRVSNPADRARRVTLALAIRPFQVNPPTQFLGAPGGAAPVDSIEFDERGARVNGECRITSLTPITASGGSRFAESDVIEDLARGASAGAMNVRDPDHQASGALTYTLSLEPHQSRDVVIRVTRAGPDAGASGAGAAARGDPAAEWNRAWSACRAHWRERLDAVQISIPDREVERTLKAQLAYMLINRRGSAIQPGPRAYARSWIRDGSLISAALLRLGRADVVQEYLEWFAALQYADGRVPCCADQRGADPVPELDSNGEYLYLVAEVLRLGDGRELAERLWPSVSRAVAFMDSLRALEPPASLGDSLRAACRGILPPSISHEGYSAKPMHSYWDDAFALRGYRDAAAIAESLGRHVDAASIRASGEQFAADFSASVRAALRLHGIDYVPGCADLGDFDATSSAIALSPLQVGDVFPPAALSRTFEKYWSFFDDRASGRTPWTAFTPYEVRLGAALTRLGMRERADSLMRFFLAYRRPAGWAQWPEVVYHDEKQAQFIGDSPHTWVGAEYARSVLEMLAYERDRDRALVLGAGAPRRWLDGGGVSVRRMPTRFGPVSFGMSARSDTVIVRIESAAPPGGFVIRAPSGARSLRFASVNGRPASLNADGELTLHESPASVRLWP